MTYEHLSLICLMLWLSEDDLAHPYLVKCSVNHEADSVATATIIVKDCAAVFRACQPCIQQSA